MGRIDTEALLETTIEELQARYETGEWQCVEVVRWHLTRIDAFDQLDVLMAEGHPNYVTTWVGVDRMGDLYQSGGANILGLGFPRIPPIWQTAE